MSIKATRGEQTRIWSRWNSEELAALAAELELYGWTIVR